MKVTLTGTIVCSENIKDVSKAGNLIIEVVAMGDAEASEYGFSVILSDFLLN